MSEHSITYHCILLSQDLFLNLISNNLKPTCSILNMLQVCLNFREGASAFPFPPLI